MKERGSGFNSDSDIVLSKGRLAAGTNAYNTTFGISYFDPQFFTKIIIETTPAGYDEGKYVFGVDSGAYGVVEGTPSGVYTTGTILFVTTLSGRFLPGETIRDEDGNTVRIAKENTISHFVVQNRGLGYADGVTLLINGLEYDNSKIELKVGFSHIVSIDIPKNDVQVSINNNLILIEGSDPSIVGNYAARIRNIKIPDSYKGKGFWYKNEKKSLKEIKKA